MEIDKKETSQREKPLIEIEDQDRLIKENLTEEEVAALLNEGFSKEQIAYVANERAKADKQWELIEAILDVAPWIF